MAKTSVGFNDIRSTLLIGGISVSLIWILSILGIFLNFNSTLYESNPNFFAGDTGSKVVTVVLEKHDHSKEQIIRRLAAGLNQFSPRKIIYLSDDAQLLSGIDQDIGNFIFVPIAQRTLSNEGVISLKIAPGINAEQTGVALPPMLEKGIVRSASLSYQGANGPPLQSFLHNFSSQINNNTAFRINFNKVSPYIAEISSEQILQNNLVEQLIKDKYVLIGDANSSLQSTLVTPLETDGLGMSLLQFHGLSLDAVLSAAELTESSSLESVLVIILSLVLIVLSMHKLSFHANLFVLLLIVMIGLAGIILLSHLLGRILPMGEFVLSCIASYWVYFHILQNRMANQDGLLTAMIKTNLSTTFQQQSFNEVAQPWVEIVAFVQQYLHLNKTIFLEKTPKDHRVKEIQALNCSIDDIKEMRRDYERTPYSTALKENAPVEIKSGYFTNTQEAEIEFIVPLVFAGEVLGFWAMSYQPTPGWNRSKFLLNVQSFAEQIANLLYYRLNFQRDLAAGNTVWQQLAQFFFPHKSANRLKQLVHSSLTRLSLYQNIFNSAHSGAVIYDLFGRVIEVNQNMEIVSNRCNLNIFNINALELLRSISGLEDDVVRARMRYVILSQKTSHFTATSALDQHTYIVSVTPIVADQAKSQTVADTEHPFSVIGLLVEFIDVGSMSQLMNIERGVHDQYINNIKNSLSIMQLLHMQLSQNLQNKSGQKEVADELQSLSGQMLQHLTRMGDNTAETHQMLNKLIADKTAAIVPADVSNLLQICLKEYKPTMLEKNISIDLHFPSITVLAVANREELLEALKLMFVILIEDAQINSKITVLGKHKMVNNRTVFYMSLGNTGFGIPKEHIPDVHANQQEEKSGDMDQLQQIIDGMQRWGGKGRVFSRLGSGIRFSILLTGVSLSA